LTKVLTCEYCKQHHEESPTHDGCHSSELSEVHGLLHLSISFVEESEGWRHGFQSLIGSCHPNIWTFLGKLKRQQSLHHVQLTQILAGDVIPQRKKYQDAASCVLHLVQNYGNHVLDFLIPQFFYFIFIFYMFYLKTFFF
jgi:hypothetical protein